MQSQRTLHPPETGSKFRNGFCVANTSNPKQPACPTVLGLNAPGWGLRPGEATPLLEADRSEMTEDVSFSE